MRDPESGLDPYDAYRQDPKFHMKVNVIAQMNDLEPIEVISKGWWGLPVEDRLLGIGL